MIGGASPSENLFTPTTTVRPASTDN
jgi:hypothetical protein